MMHQLVDQSFVLVDRAEQLKVLQFNKKISFEYKTMSSGMRYCIIRNVLQEPEAFIQYLKKHPAYGGSIRVSSPGYRQLFSPLEFKALHDLYYNVYKKLSNISTDKPNNPLTWICCSNIYYKGMTGNPKPHNDGSTLAANLWLSEAEGTAFYRYKDAYTIDDIDDDNEDMAEYNDLTQKQLQDNVPWYAFDCDDKWSKYDIIPAEYNSAVLYNGRYFHQAYFDPNKHPETYVRYSLVSFLANYL
jgi:hypothetical protein